MALGRVPGMLVTVVYASLHCQAATPPQAGYICSGEHDRQDPGFWAGDLMCCPPCSQSPTVLARDVSWVDNFSSCLRKCSRPHCYFRLRGCKSLVHELKFSQLLFLIVLSGHSLLKSRRAASTAVPQLESPLMACCGVESFRKLRA